MFVLFCFVFVCFMHKGSDQLKARIRRISLKEAGVPTTVEIKACQKRVLLHPPTPTERKQRQSTYVHVCRFFCGVKSEMGVGGIPIF